MEKMFGISQTEALFVQETHFGVLVQNPKVFIKG